MPILDLGVWITSLSDKVMHDVNVKLLHEQYFKDISCDRCQISCTLEGQMNSAHPGAYQSP